MAMPRLLTRLAVAGLLLLAGTAGADDTVRVYAAASLADALGEIAADWRRDRAIDVRLNLASSGALARQIAAGAPADLFLSADPAWMDDLQARGRIDASSRVDLLGNRLVLIAPAARPVPVEMRASFDLASAFRGRLCTGDTGSVPAGIYAKAALQSLGWWPRLEHRLAGAADVRAALALVERGECALGIVYATDAAASTRVTVLGEFPAGTHPPIVYPAALAPGAGAAARGFFRYLQGDDARAVFRRRGFVVLPAGPR